MRSLFDSVLKTAALFGKCDGIYSQSIILKEECAELIVALSHFERNRKGSFNEILEELSHVLISCFAFIICAKIPVGELIVEVNKKYNKYHLKSEGYSTNPLPLTAMGRETIGKNRKER